MLLPPGPHRAGPISNLVGVFVIWPFTVGGVKRLHDLGLSGWLWPAYAVVASGGWLLFLLMPDSGFGVAGAVPASLLGLVFGIYIYFMPGTSGPNPYGPDPLGE